MGIFVTNCLDCYLLTNYDFDHSIYSDFFMNLTCVR
jgi:hypothetical protein